MIKPLVSQQEIEKKKKRRNYLFIALMLVILIGSSAGFAFLSNPGNTNNPSNTNSNGVTSVGDKFALQYGQETLYFANSPESVKEIPVDMIFTLNNYYSKPLYLAVESDIVSYELSSTVGRYAERVQKACYGECNSTLPEKNCTDNLIVWINKEDNKVYQQDNCVFLEGDLKASDAFLYKLFKVN